MSHASTLTVKPSLGMRVRIQLSVMMFLQYAVLGVWGVTLPTFLMAAPHEGAFCLERLAAIASA